MFSFVVFNWSNKSVYFFELEMKETPPISLVIKLQLSLSLLVENSEESK